MPSELPQKLIRLEQSDVDRGDELIERLAHDYGIPCRSWSDLMRMGLKLIEKRYPPEGSKKGRPKKDKPG